MSFWHTPGVASTIRMIRQSRSEAFETDVPPWLLATEDDAGVLAAVRRGGRRRRAAPGERIGRRSRYSWIIRGGDGPGRAQENGGRRGGGVRQGWPDRRVGDRLHVVLRRGQIGRAGQEGTAHPRRGHIPRDRALGDRGRDPVAGR